MVPGPEPFRTLLVLENHLGPTELLIRCTHCRQTYLLEMLDWRGSLRAFRISSAEDGATAALLVDLERGSCDVNRARVEVRHFTLTSNLQPDLLVLDSDKAAIDSVATVTESAQTIPREPWRHLPCDGSWIDAIQADRL